MIKMKKAYGTYKIADVDEAKTLLKGDGKCKAVLYKDGDDFRIAMSVFTDEGKGFMRHVILPDTLSEICEDPKEGQELFDKICSLKAEGNLYYRIGSLEHPAYYSQLVSPESEVGDLVDDSYFRHNRSVETKFPFFRENESYPEGMDINDYVSRSSGFMEFLHESIVQKAEKHLSYIGVDDQSVSHYGRLRSSVLSPILYKLEKNGDGTLPDLSMPVRAPASQAEIDRVEAACGVRPENGQYNQGFRFSPVLFFGMNDRKNGQMKSLLAGHITETQARKYEDFVLFSTPYLFNLRSSSGEARHDIVIDPIRAANIIEASSIIPTATPNLVAKGVFRGCVVDYKREPSPPLKDDTYLYRADEIDCLYSNASGDSKGLSVSRMFRDPMLDTNANHYAIRDIEGHERVAKGFARDIYIPPAELTSDSYRFQSDFTPPRHFSESTHNHYISMVTKYGYLKRGGGSKQSEGLDGPSEGEVIAEAVNDEIMF